MVIIFLAMRDWLQRMTDRMFHRETYDSATVVSGFEEKLAGMYRDDELKSVIVKGLDEIFHFKSPVFNLRKNDRIYEPAFLLGIDNQEIKEEFAISSELEKMGGSFEIESSPGNGTSVLFTMNLFDERYARRV